MGPKLNLTMQAWWMEQRPEEMGKALQKAETSPAMSQQVQREKATSQAMLRIRIVGAGLLPQEQF